MIIRTMKSFTSITALLLCSLSWISVSGAKTPIEKVKPGEDVTLRCPNISKTSTQTDWFRKPIESNPCCISSMKGSDGDVTSCDGFQNRKFKMSSNNSTVFLKIKEVDLSDSGLYFCGFYIKPHTVIANATYLIVDGYGEDADDWFFVLKEWFDGVPNLVTVILGCLTLILFIVITVLAVQNRKLQKAVKKNRRLEKNKNLNSDGTTYTALSLQAQAN